MRRSVFSQPAELFFCNLLFDTHIPPFPSSPPHMWSDEEDSTESLKHHYMFTACDGDACPPVLIVFSPTDKGWCTRSTSVHHELWHDYDRRLTMEDIVNDWISDSIVRPYATSDRDGVLELLTREYPGSWTACGRFHGDPSSSAKERAERVLRHLEV